MAPAQKLAQLLFFLGGEWRLSRLVEEVLNLTVGLSCHQCSYGVEKLLFKVGTENIQYPFLFRQPIELLAQRSSMPPGQQFDGRQLRVLLQGVDQRDQ